jgi:hypothetical protein
MSTADHVFRDRGLTYVDPEFQQFAVDPRGSPTWIRVRHASNQCPDGWRDRRSPDPTTTLPAPEQAEGAAVPGNDGLGFDDDERCAPVAPDTGQPHPQQAVRLSEPQPLRPRPLQYLQLVPQRQHLQLQDGARARATSQGQREREEDGHDGGEAYAAVAGKINGINRNRLFSRHRLQNHAAATSIRFWRTTGLNWRSSHDGESERSQCGSVPARQADRKR